MLHCVAPPRAAEECMIYDHRHIVPRPPLPYVHTLLHKDSRPFSPLLSPIVGEGFRSHKIMVTAEKPDAMSTLANAASVDVAASGVGAGTKRSGDDLAVAATAKKPKQATTGGLITTQWSNLMTHVRNQLVSMSSDQCFARALELQMLANQILSAQVSGNSFQSHQPIVHTHAPVMAMPSNPQQEGQQPQQLKQQQQQQSGTRATKAERDVSKQKPIKVTKAAPIPCMKMTTPLPPRCEVDNAPDVEIPTFCELVNFPTARYYQNCVMCDESEYTIPKQNKGVCNNCDVAIWVVNPSGMQIKWCKGCKNFRKWVEFGTKGFSSSKCDRCRRQQAVRYSIQKNKGEGGNTMEEESERQAWFNQHTVVNPAEEQQEQRDL